MKISHFISDLEYLPKHVKQQILDYIQFLLKKYSIPKKYGQKKFKKEFKFDWEGGLKSLKQKYTSVELQHITNNLR